MNNIAIDVVKSNTIQSEYDNKNHIRVAMPADAYDDDSSNNSKKSRKTLLKKMLAAPPKLDKYTTPSMTAKAMANVYQNLSAEKKEKFLDEIASQNGAMRAVYNSLPDKVKEEFEEKISQTISKKFLGIYDNLSAQDKANFSDEINPIPLSFINSMPKAQRDEFLTKFGAFLEKQSNLSASDKLAIEDFVKKINKYVNKSNGNSAPQGSNDNFDDSGITNIMMILVKVFCQAMNVESMDMLQQIQDMKFTNKFLDQAKKVLENNISKLNKPTGSDIPWYKHWGLWIAIGVVVAVVAIGFITGQFEFLADMPAIIEGAVDEAGIATDGTLATDGVGDGVAEDFTSEEIENGVDLPDCDEISSQEGASSSEASSAPDASEAEEEQATQGNLDSAEKKVADGQNGDDTPQARKKRAWQNFKKLKLTTRGKLRMKQLGTPVWKFGKILGFGAAAIFASQMIGSQYAPTWFIGPAKQENSTELQKFSQTAQLEGVIVDQMNNKLQTASKNEGNDSDKISQFANFVNQAINMFGQSFVTRS